MQHDDGVALALVEVVKTQAVENAADFINIRQQRCINDDIGIKRDVTETAIWRTSDSSIAAFDTPGTLTARAAGSVRLWAEVDGMRSNDLSIEVFETSEISYCDGQNVNRALWSEPRVLRPLSESD